MKRLVHVPMGTYSASAFRSLAPQVTSTDPKDLRDGDCLVIWGGADIHPSLYGERNVASYVGNGPSDRDKIESTMFKAAVEKGVPIIGICRGAQLACALSGGTLFQHIEHPGQHGIQCEDGKLRITNSVHHQMMRPEKTDHKLIAWVPALSHVHECEEGDIDIENEPEIVYFNKTKALAIQGHPEFVVDDHPFRKYSLELINDYIQ